jgi:hypothetical protein
LDDYGGIMNNFKYKLQRWMYGRYGQDELSKALNWMAVILLIVSAFVNSWILYLLGIVSCGWSIFRTLSRNISKRQMERMSYLRITDKYRRKVIITKRRITDRKTYVYYQCPTCKTYNRVPKGHGRIEITCPKCRTKFIKG